MRALATTLVATILMAASPALATPTLDECVTASEDAQTLRLKGQLRVAREKLLVCANEACPKLVKKDCGAWFDEVDRAIPTIVFSVRGASGSDLTDVRVSVDGVALLEHLDGKAVPVDVGPHKVRFEAPGLSPQEENVVAREGEKNRIVTVTLAQPPAAVVTPPPVVSPPTETVDRAEPTHSPVDSPRRGPSAATWVVGGLGLATLAVAGVVGAFSLNERSSLYDRCGAAGTCSQADVDGVYALYDTAYVAVALGSALLVTSVVLLLVTKPQAKAPSTAMVMRFW
jgi:hypothetical protein